MYVTRPLSLYLNNPDALYLPPPEGPNSGYLVLQDEESTQTCCFGFCKLTQIGDLPFPQNKLLNFTSGSDDSTTSDLVYLIPAINQPLSSNTYYAIKQDGRRHQGEAYASSTEEDMVTCCCGNVVKDVEPRPLDPADIYQQFKFSMEQNCGKPYVSGPTSVASNGYPPSFLRGRWTIYSRTPKNFSLGEAEGMDPRYRARLPDLNFPLSYKASNPVTVGKWYCPFMFVKELTPKEQVKKSLFYEMTLEQRWERIFLYENDKSESMQGNKTVFVDITVPTESVTVAERDDIQDNQENGVVWFNSMDGRTRIGLSSLIVERMMWEEERAGWVRKAEKQEKVLKIEEFGGVGMWARYGCYMLVETFVLKRMDGSVVLTYSFNHTHQIRSKWD